MSEIETETRDRREFEVRLGQYVRQYIAGKDIPSEVSGKFGKNKSGLLCPLQSTESVKIDEFSFEILNQDSSSGKASSIANFGKGKKRVKIVFIPSEIIRDYLIEPDMAVTAVVETSSGQKVLVPRRQMKQVGENIRQPKSSSGTN